MVRRTCDRAATRGLARGEAVERRPAASGLLTPSGLRGAGRAKAGRGAAEGEAAGGGGAEAGGGAAAEGGREERREGDVELRLEPVCDGG